MTSPNSGCPSRTRRSGPASSVTSSPARSAASTSAADTPARASTPTSSGSPKATSSPTTCTAAGRPPIRASINSTNCGGALTGPVPAPDALDIGQGGRLAPPTDQLSQIEDVSAAELPQLLFGQSVHRRAQRSLDQLADLGAGQGLDLQPFSRAVLPQCRDWLRRGLSGAQRGDHESHAGDHKVEHQRGRGIIQQVRVI